MTTYRQRMTFYVGRVTAYRARHGADCTPSRQTVKRWVREAKAKYPGKKSNDLATNRQ